LERRTFSSRGSTNKIVRLFRDRRFTVKRREDLGLRLLRTNSGSFMRFPFLERVVTGYRG
jgi:hypothetical protein